MPVCRLAIQVRILDGKDSTLDIARENEQDRMFHVPEAEEISVLNRLDESQAVKQAGSRVEWPTVQNLCHRCSGPWRNICLADFPSRPILFHPLRNLLAFLRVHRLPTTFRLLKVAAFVGAIPQALQLRYRSFEPFKFEL